MRALIAALVACLMVGGCATPAPTRAPSQTPASATPAIVSPTPSPAVVATPSRSPRPYALECGPVPASTCESAAKVAVAEATKQHQGTVVSVRLTDTLGSFDMRFADGQAVVSIYEGIDAGPAVTCAEPPTWTTLDASGSEVPLVPDLTCANGVAAAERVLPATDSPVVVKFQHGRYCPPGARCAATLPDIGFVVFTMGDGSTLWAVVHADGTDITATFKGSFPP